MKTDEARAKAREYSRRPDVKARAKAYRQHPAVKARKAAWQREYLRTHPEARERQKLREREYSKNNYGYFHVNCERIDCDWIEEQLNEFRKKGD